MSVLRIQRKGTDRYPVDRAGRVLRSPGHWVRRILAHLYLHLGSGLWPYLSLAV